MYLYDSINTLATLNALFYKSLLVDVVSQKDLVM